MELTNEEKTSIVTQHIKNVMLNIYNLQLSLIGENAIDPINQTNIDNLNKQLLIENAKVQALEEELNRLAN